MRTTTETTPELIAEKYFEYWQAGNFDALRELFADDVDFVGAMGTAQGIEEVMQGLQGLGRILSKIDVKKRLADDTDVITWFDLHTEVAAPAPTVNWTHVEDGKITRIRVTFDPRELLAGLAKK